MSLASVPLLLGDSALGCISLKFQHAHKFTAQEEELAFALANQVTLALEMTRLADEARDLAVARERELAAQQRAVELSNAKKILAESLDALAADPELERFLAHSVKAIATQLGAPGSILWLHDRTAREEVLDSNAQEAHRIAYGRSEASLKNTDDRLSGMNSTIKDLR